MAEVPSWLNPDLTAAWQRLQRHLDWAENFWLGVVTTQERENARWLAGQANANRHAAAQPFRYLAPPTPEELAVLLGRIEQDGPGPGGCTWVEAVQLSVPEPGQLSWQDAWARFLQSLNHRRDTLRSRLGGLVLVGPPYVKPLAMRFSSDLWSVLAFLSEISPETQPVYMWRDLELDVDVSKDAARDVPSKADQSKAIPPQPGFEPPVQGSPPVIPASPPPAPRPQAPRPRAPGPATPRAEPTQAGAREQPAQARPFPAFWDLDQLGENQAREVARLLESDDAALIGPGRRKLETRIEWARVHGYSATAATLLSRLAGALYTGRPQEAAPLFEQAAELFTRITDRDPPRIRARIAFCYERLASISAMRADYQQALAYLTRALSEREAAGDAGMVAQVLHDLGLLAQHAGDLERADASLRQALSLYSSAGDHQNAAACRLELGGVAEARGDLEAAAGAYLEAQVEYERLGNRAGAARAYLSLGHVLARRDEYERALASYRQALDIYREISVTVGVAESFAAMGALFTQTGQLDDAVKYTARSLAISLNSPGIQGNLPWLARQRKTLGPGKFRKALSRGLNTNVVDDVLRALDEDSQRTEG